MRFLHEQRYDAPPADVHAMLSDPTFREKVCLAQRATNATVSIEWDGQAMLVLVDQTRTSEGIPGFARKIVGDEIRIVQREDWSSSSQAALDVSIPGKPGQLTGTILVSGKGTGTSQIIEGDLKVSVPLLGGRLESLVSELLTNALEAELDVGRDWLRGDR